jgi:ABC-type polysaccharide/polyol phosphate transport system ATPase subunit
MRELCGEARSIVLVSHGLRSIREMCDEVIWMNEGRIMMRDDADSVIDAYKEYLQVGESEATDEDV